MQIYDELMALCEDDQNLFYFKDQTTAMGMNVRIFNYHFVSYTDWLKPSALECRGIMFKMVDGVATEILTRPMAKFFNLRENPFTTDLDMNEIEFFMDKADGSLVSTYLDNGRVRMKSKASIHSDQSIWANQYIDDWSHEALRFRVQELAEAGFTCNFEYVAPHNRVVLGYQDTRMILLNVRENESGNYVPYNELKSDPVLRKYLVPGYIIEDGTDPAEFVESVYQMQGIEGYVFKMQSGLFFKVKTDWYSELHNVKASLNNNKALMMLARLGVLDDVRALFSDEYSLTKINTFEKIFLGFLMDSLKVIRELHKKYHGLSRKDYAVGSQTELTLLNKPYLFGLFMSLFNGMIVTEALVEAISEVFTKNVDLFIPEEYRDPVKT